MFQSKEIPVCPERFQDREMIENGSRGGRLQRANKQLGVIATLRLHHDLPEFGAIFADVHSEGGRPGRDHEEVEPGSAERAVADGGHGGR